MAQKVKNLPAMQETRVQSLGWEDPLKKETATHSSIHAWKNPMNRGAWWATFHGITESVTTEQLTLEVKEKPVIFMLTFKPIFLIKFVLF